MSLVALAIRMAARKALNNATFAGARIFDSAVMPIDQIAGKEPTPFVSISTEDETSKPSGRDLNNGDRLIDLVIEIAIGEVVELPGEDGEGIAIRDTDATLELALAILTRQINATLFGLGGGAWGEVFRAFVKTIEEFNGRRGVPTKDGQRFAARQLAYRVRAFAEPEFGPVIAGTPFDRFLAVAEDDETLAPVVEVIRNAIEGRPIDWPELYTAAAVAGGYTEEEGQSIGIAPLGGHASAPVEEMTVEPSGVVMDQTMIDEALPPEEEEDG